MLRFAKAHAYGNDFLFVRESDLAGRPAADLARTLCDRHTGVGADGLILFSSTPDGATMRLFNADGSPSEVSGNGVRGLAALHFDTNPDQNAAFVIHTQAGDKSLVRTGVDGSRQIFRAAMGVPRKLARVDIVAAGESLPVVTMDFGNPQCVVLGPLPDRERFERLGPAIERHNRFPARTNVEFAHVDAPDVVRILIWERGVGETSSSGTGSCAALIAAAAYGGAARDAQVIAPGGTQRVEWCEDNVYLTGWAEILFQGTWHGDG